MAALSGQAQENQEQPNWCEQSECPALPSIVRVEVVEDQAKADSAKAAAQEAKNREIRDLLAQEGMHSEAKRMADYAVAQTILTAIGAGLVFASLVLALQANRAAIRAVDVTEKYGATQSRAYVVVDNIRIQNFLKTKTPELYADVRNCGDSPAHDVRVLIVSGFTSASPNYCPIRFDKNVETSAQPLGPGQISTATMPLPRSDEPFVIDAVVNSKTTVVFAGYVIYRDAFGTTRRTIFRSYLEPENLRDGAAQMTICTRHNRMT